MKLFRYRKPPLKTVLGLTKVKWTVKRSLGVSQVQGWTRPSRVKQIGRGERSADRGREINLRVGREVPVR